MRKLLSGCAAAAMLAGCASSASDIKAAYVSPVAYETYTCRQLSEEAQRVSSHAAQASGEQDSKRTSDQVATTAAVVVFWPALFLMKGDGATAAELGRLKGEMDAIEQTSIRKNCGITFNKA
jgi:hypothetical protein